MRVTTYSTKLTCEGKAILEKEISVNCPNIDRMIIGDESYYSFKEEEAF